MTMLCEVLYNIAALYEIFYDIAMLCEVLYNIAVLYVGLLYWLHSMSAVNIFMSYSHL